MLLGFVLSALAAVSLAGQTEEIADLSELSLDELMNLRVTLASKREQPVIQTPAAIYVVTNRDVESAGIMHPAEALRWVPGLQVARVDSHAWAVSARGFNDVFANKLLVMVDGRSVYTPLFSGVYWEVLDVLLEDLDRIEVIRGPGAALWGANAVNGVINFVSRSSVDTQGLLMSGGAGDFEETFWTVRYGGTVTDALTYRVYARGFEGGESRIFGGGKANDAWRRHNAGFRIDASNSAWKEIALMGGVYDARLEQTYFLSTFEDPDGMPSRDTIDQYGGNLLLRLTRDMENLGTLKLQAYLDATVRDASVFRERRETLDLEIQQNLFPKASHAFSWGGGFRHTVDEVRNSFSVTLDPDSDRLNLFNFFAQDEVRLLRDRLILTAGAKIEHHSLTGWELQPNIRGIWSDESQRQIWFAVSRAVRTPSRAENALRLNSRVIPPGALFPGPLPVVEGLTGSRDYESEVLVAWELGYRAQPAENFTFDLAGFYNDYSNLRSVRAAPPEFQTEPVPHLLVAGGVGNEMWGETYGFEFSANADLPGSWRAILNYSHLRIRLHSPFSGPEAEQERNGEGMDPVHQATLRLESGPIAGWRPWGGLRYVDRLRSLDIDAYLELDFGIRWNPRPDLTLEIYGKNLLDRSHPEFLPTSFPNEATEVPRSFLVKLSWRH